MVRSIGYRVRIRVRGELEPTWWSDLFAGLTVAPEPDGTTWITGRVPDQAALHGLLGTIRDLGLPLVMADATTDPADPGDPARPGASTGGTP